MNLNAKQQGLLKDLQSDEKMCAEKYRRAAQQACDPVLKDMFSQIAQSEEGHFQAITQMMGGTVPQPRGVEAQRKMTPQELRSKADAAGMQKDQYLLSDLLATEKFTAGVYNSSVFEFGDEQARQVLSGIQQQEQHHGKRLSDYMQANNMYC